MNNCGLLLVALLAACTETRTESGGPSGHQGHVAPSSAPAPSVDHAQMAGMPAGYAPVLLDADRAKTMGLASAPVEHRAFTKPLRTVGVVTLDETRSAHVHPKVRGWIDGLRVNYVGQAIRQGDVLCSIYSQEVYSAELEFLAVADSLAGRAPPSGEFAQVERDAQRKLLEAAKRRLLLWDVPESEVARLTATREPRRTFPLLAPRAGVVVAKQAIEGMYVDASLELYTLSDLSRVWVLADVYEADVPFVHTGDAATLHVEGAPGAVESRIAFLAPTIDEATRTLKARFELDDEDRRFRPGAFVSIEMKLAMGHGVALPESSVIRTGARAIVFVVSEKEGGVQVEPREVILGPLVGDAYRVDAGVTTGERVATGAQFLLDSESRLRATSGPTGGHVH